MQTFGFILTGALISTAGFFVGNLIIAGVKKLRAK
jgi:hypothetical protein